MASPSNRTEFVNYCKRQLGAPVLEINIADEQVEDVIDDAVQYFQERHFDGVAQTYIRITVQPDSNDIVPVRNQILEIDTTNLSVSGAVELSSTSSFLSKKLSNASKSEKYSNMFFKCWYMILPINPGRTTFNGKTIVM